MYIFYLLRHKFWVMYYCFKHGLFWRGLAHDWDKLLLPSMLYVYAKYYPQIRKIRDTSGNYDPCAAPEDYQKAILAHFNRSRHHWQYWILANGVSYKALDMTETDVREMICDWAGAGRTRLGKNGPKRMCANFLTIPAIKWFFRKTIRLIEKNLDSMGW